MSQKGANEKNKERIECMYDIPKVGKSCRRCRRVSPMFIGRTTARTISGHWSQCEGEIDSAVRSRVENATSQKEISTCSWLVRKTGGTCIHWLSIKILSLYLFSFGWKCVELRLSQSPSSSGRPFTLSFLSSFGYYSPLFQHTVKWESQWIDRDNVTVWLSIAGFIKS